MDYDWSSWVEVEDKNKGVISCLLIKLDKTLLHRYRFEEVKTSGCI